MRLFAVEGNKKLRETVLTDSKIKTPEQAITQSDTDRQADRETDRVEERWRE